MTPSSEPDRPDPHREKKPGRALAAIVLIPLLLLLAAALVPFFRPVYLQAGRHKAVIAFGIVEEMERLRFGFGFSYGGEGRDIRFGSRELLFWWNEGTQIPSDPNANEAPSIQLLPAERPD